MDVRTGNEIYNVSENFSRFDKSRYAVRSARSRWISGDRQDESEANI